MYLTKLRILRIVKENSFSKKERKSTNEKIQNSVLYACSRNASFHICVLRQQKGASRNMDFGGGDTEDHLGVW